MESTPIYQIKERDLGELAKKIVEEIRISERETEKKEAKKRPRFYTRKEVCDILRITPATFHSLVNKGKIDVTKVGWNTLVDAEVFDRDVKEGLVAKYKR